MYICSIFLHKVAGCPNPVWTIYRVRVALVVAFYNMPTR